MALGVVFVVVGEFPVDRVAYLGSFVVVDQMLEAYVVVVVVAAVLPLMEVLVVKESLLLVVVVAVVLPLLEVLAVEESCLLVVDFAKPLDHFEVVDYLIDYLFHL